MVSKDIMAVKVYNLNALGELNKVQLIREIRLHGSFTHRNIIELFVAFQVCIRAGVVEACVGVHRCLSNNVTQCSRGMCWNPTHEFRPHTPAIRVCQHHHSMVHQQEA